MSKTLIIAEKPNVAAEIASALEVPKANGCFENAELVISNCIGHLLEIVMPEKDVSLPILPNELKLEPKEETKRQYDFLVKQMHRADVNVIVNACDADREGESIFRRVYDSIACTKPVQRMWIQSTTKDGYVSAFANRKSGSEFNNLYAAAKSRAEADWLFGINGSRIVKSAVGRVQTPTLAMVVDAYHANKNFKPKDYWEISAEFGLKNGKYESKLLDKEGNIARFMNEQEAQTVLNQIKRYRDFTVIDELKPSLKNAPYLFDSAELQKVANQQFKYSADKTLKIMQNLYQHYKVMTYPRSDYNALPEDYLPTISNTILALGHLEEYASIVSNMQNSDLIVQNKRIFDNKRIDSHYAIVPTGLIKVDGKEISLSDLTPSQLKTVLPLEEYNILNLIVLRTLAAFYPAAEYSVTTRTTCADGYVFRVSGRILTVLGWLAVYGSVEQEQDKLKENAIELPVLLENEQATVLEMNLDKRQTKAPSLLTESSLLQAMKTAGKEIEDEELASLMREIKGIGTSATRAPTIAKLKEAYVFLEKNYLIPSEKGIKVIEYIRENYPSLADPIVTAEWEHILQKIEHGHHQREDFMCEIRRTVTEFVEKMKQKPLLTKASFAESEWDCPCCKAAKLNDYPKSLTCASCGFILWKQISSKKLSDTAIKKLLKLGKSDLIKGFISKSGKPFDAFLLIDKESKKVVFEFPKRAGK